MRTRQNITAPNASNTLFFPEITRHSRIGKLPLHGVIFHVYKILLCKGLDDTLTLLIWKKFTKFHVPSSPLPQKLTFIQSEFPIFCDWFHRFPRFLFQRPSPHPRYSKIFEKHSRLILYTIPSNVFIVIYRFDWRRFCVFEKKKKKKEKWGVEGNRVLG